MPAADLAPAGADGRDPRASCAGTVGRSSGSQALRPKPASYGPSLPGSFRSQCVVTVVVPEYRCGAAPDSHRVPFSPQYVGNRREESIPAWGASVKDDVAGRLAACDDGIKRDSDPMTSLALSAARSAGWNGTISPVSTARPEVSRPISGRTPASVDEPSGGRARSVFSSRRSNAS
jgi:hypothetical protein